MSRHGTWEDTQEARNLIREEWEEEQGCMRVGLQDESHPDGVSIHGVITRGGATTDPPADNGETSRPGDPEVVADGGTKPHESTITEPKGKSVAFSENLEGVQPGLEESESEDEIVEIVPGGEGSGGEGEGG